MTLKQKIWFFTSTSWTYFWLNHILCSAQGWVSETVINKFWQVRSNTYIWNFYLLIFLKSTFKFKTKSENIVFHYGLRNTMFPYSISTFLWLAFTCQAGKNPQQNLHYILCFVSAHSGTYRYLSTKAIVKIKASNIILIMLTCKIFD